MPWNRWRDAVRSYRRKFLAPPRYDGESLSLISEDGIRIAAWRLRQGAPVGAVLVAHGFVSSSRSPRIHAFAQACARSATVVVPDLRGHGRSSGWCSFGEFEHLDLKCALDATDEDRVVVVGVSLGAIAALRLAAEERASGSDRLAAVVAVSAPAELDLTTPGMDRLRRWTDTTIRRSALAGVTRTRTRRLAAPPVEGPEVVAAISPTPVIFVHDPSDWYFGPGHAERLFAAAGDPKQLWWYRGLGHGTDLLTEELSERVIALL